MRFYQVDSFAAQVFSGNPAGVCLVGASWPDSGLMQRIAMENNLSETAFVMDSGGALGIRWFTPTVEVPLCGHGTLAAAHVLFCHEGYEGPLVFESAHHKLGVTRDGDMLTLDFPRAKIWQVDFSDETDCFKDRPAEVWRSEDEYLLVFDSRGKVAEAVCNMAKAAQISLNGIIITAADGDGFVSRYFGPKIGINEDPVTGSAHTLLVPYWQGITGRSEFAAEQLSPRGGQLYCAAVGDRVRISGRAVTYLRGEIFV